MHDLNSREVIRGGLAGWQAKALIRFASASLQTLTVAAMAQAVSLSPHHFSRAFRTTFGVSPREWLLQQRMIAARSRLETTSDTVEQIAIDLGYSSGSQFCRAFRARFGVSPRVYRRA
jgi:AraC family transcriptional regulator